MDNQLLADLDESINCIDDDDEDSNEDLIDSFLTR